MLKALTAALTLSLAMATAAMAQAPAPKKPIDPQKFYTGTWLEVARRPMAITDNCPAGTTAYTRTTEPTTIFVRDACRVGTPSGPEKWIAGTGRILDPGMNTKLFVRYNIFASREYWILDRAADYSWFIEASPDFNDLYIFTRKVPSKRLLASLVRRAKAMGYDVRRLEFPAQPPR